MDVTQLALTWVEGPGVEYKDLRENLERFLESNAENCWIEYLSNMAKQGILTN